ncbi:putative Ig domain-containing protein [Caulobacter hibisci]|uniref:Autotransporter domain-containing protein n=1 Tax=Caulobacter hibisci TaxID=2035993 RepID=A0ABS0T2M0_9CAUL|nr:putative Ig domain-containing protein [Caulobacter hibisci]MBI1686132.1 autotransporter domain-containing protein [Caulobacter hibisci]
MSVATRLRALAVVVMVALAALAPAAALASDMCDLVNAGVLDQTSVFSGGAIISSDARQSSSGVNSYQGIGLTTSAATFTDARFYNGGAKYAHDGTEVFRVTATINLTSGTLRAALQRASNNNSPNPSALAGSTTSSGTFTYDLSALTQYAMGTQLGSPDNLGTGTVSVAVACYLPPTITSVSPTSGPQAGTNSVTINGTYLSGATLTVDGASVTPTSTTAGTVVFTAPAHAPGLVSLVVTTPAGTASSSYTYIAAPTISSLSPSSGPTAGTNSVTINGTNLAGATLTVAGGAVTPTSTNATSVVFTAPAHAAGPVTVAVTTSGGTASSTYTYVAAPTISSVSPSSGPLAGTNSVTINGSNLSGATLTVDGGSVTPTSTSASTVVFTAPANAAGSVALVVTTGGGSASSSYEYVTAPTISSLSPSSGPTGGGDVVTISGSNLSNATLTVDGVGVTPTSASASSIVFNTPAHVAGSIAVVVTTAGGSASSGYTFLAAPTISSVSPSSGSTAGGTTVTINGSNLSGATLTVDGGGVTPTSTTATTVVFTSPAHAAGAIALVVTTGGGSASTTYTYVAPPTASSFTYGSIIAYNTGANATTSIDVATGGSVTNSPTGYAVGSATTAQGGSVSIDSSGSATYTPPVGYRNANDSFTYTATNGAGTSSPATVTVTIGNPTLTVTLPASTATVGTVYNAGAALVTPAGGRSTYTINSISLPSGLTDAGGGVISGTPTADGVFTVTVNITDSSTGAGPYTANATATLTVSLPPAPTASSFTASAVAYNSGSASAATFSVTGHVANSPTSYAVGSATTTGGGSVSIDSAGLVSYTPAVGFRGNDSFTYTATNAGGTSSLATVTVPVSNPVLSVTLPAATGTVGAAYNSGGAPVILSGGVAPYSNISATGLPTGLTISSSGVISGTPTTATTATVIVTATDSSTGAGAYTSTASATLNIAAPTITLSPAAGALPGVDAGTAYNQTFTSTGGVAPRTYGWTGTLPPGLTLSTSGGLSGTPTTTGSFSFTVTVTDSSGNSYNASNAYSITVSAPSLVVSTSSLPGATENAAYSQTISVSGGIAPYSFNLATGSGPLPPGLTLNPTTGAISGTPTTIGSYSFIIRIQDSTSGSAGQVDQSYTLTVSPDVPPTAGAVTTTVAANSSANTVAPALSGAPAASVAVATPPTHGTATVSGLNFLYTPTAGYSGADSFTYTASNNGGSSGTATVTITVTAPTLVVTGTPPGGTVAIAYAGATFTASTGTAPYAFTGASLPTGLTLSTAGLLSGAPTAAGTFNAVITATDAHGATGSTTFPIVIAAPAVTITSPTAGALPTATAFVAYNQAFTASGGAAPRTFGVTAGALPAGLTLSPAGVLSGSATVTGTFNFTITPSDGSAAPGPYVGTPSAYSLVVGAPSMTLSPATVPNGTATVPYTATFTAAGGASPYSYAVTGGALPSGLTLSTAGVISGSAAQSATGNFNFTVTATDANGFTVAGAYGLSIAQVTLVTSSPPSGVAGQAYSQVLSTSGGTGPYTYALTTGALPAGLTLGGSGAISGTPTAAGTFGFTVTTTDSFGAVGTDTLSLTIAAPTLTLTPASAPAADWGVAYSLSFQTSGGVAPYHYVLSGSLPTGLSFNSSTGVLSGTPTDEGAFPLNVTVTDSATGSGPFTASVSPTLTVNAAPPPVVEPTNTTTPAGSPTVIDVSNLIDGFYDSVVIVDPPQHGTAVVTGGASRMRSQGGSGSVQILYTPNPGYYGSDSFTYAATGPGGTSAPAAIGVAVAAPAPVVVDDAASVAANGTVAIAVTANDTGPIATIAIASAPSHGTATVSGLSVNYVPAANFFGTDTFTYTATGEGGTGGPATVTVTVSPLSVPTQTAQVLTVLAGQAATLAATQGATGSPFTSVTIATAPTKGTATINGLSVVYTPAAGFSGADAFTYRINNPFGASNPVPVTVTVNPAPLTAPPITVEILAGQKAVVNLVAGASGGPFTGAAVATITPTNSGTAAVTNPSAGAYTLTFTPDNAFAGTAVVTYTLSNAFATSAPGRINVIVTARPDPSQDPEVKGLVAAQDAAAVRFADAQISNFNRRLEQLHNGGGAGRGFGVSVRGGKTEREDGLEARERFRKYASLGMNDAADPSSPLLPAASASDAADYAARKDDDEGQAGPKRWGVWAAGSADFGMRDTVGSQSGFRFTTDGLTGGVDYRVNDRFAFGLGLGYGRDSSKIGKNGTKSRAESYSAGLYASLQPGEKTFIDGVIGLGSLDFDTRRYVTTTGELVNGERDGDQLFAALTFGVERRTQTSLLSPYGRVAYSRSVLDAFSENGGGPYGLTYHEQTVRSLTGTLGLRGAFARKTAAGLLSPRFRVEYSHDFEKANDALLSYTDWVGGPTYRLAVDPIDRDQLRLELGADLTVKSGWTIGLDFDNMVSKDSDSQGLRLTVQSPF